MEQQPTPKSPDVGRLKVPDDLMQLLDKANERFRAAKKELERRECDCEQDHGKHVEDCLTEVHKAELEIEDINNKIQEVMERTP